MASYKLSPVTGMAIVVANMIGTGAWTSLGFQIQLFQETTVLLTLWVIGGFMALSGAFSYAEVGTAIKKSGGEYAFLSEIYHPVVGYLAGWISITVGFAAPIALSAFAFVAYWPFANINPNLAGIAVVGIITLVHVHSRKTSSWFQNVSTLLKIIVIVALILVGLFVPGIPEFSLHIGPGYVPALHSTGFAVALIYVSYSYSGWSAATYLVEEFKNPVKSLPIVLIAGTVVVTILYTLLQFIFLKHAPLHELTGQLNVGAIVAEKILGENSGRLFGMAVSLLLISGISAMVWTGARVTSSMAKEHRLWHYFRPADDHAQPRSLWLQWIISAIMLLTGTFEQILLYCGVLLTMSSMLTVLGVFFLRRKASNADTGRHYRSPLFPLFQVVFLVLSGWMIVFALINNPWKTLLGMSNLVIGLVSYVMSERMKRLAV